MAFSDYKHISQVQEAFQIVAQEGCFLILQDMEPPAQFLDEFRFNQQ